MTFASDNSQSIEHLRRNAVAFMRTLTCPSDRDPVAFRAVVERAEGDVEHALNKLAVALMDLPAKPETPHGGA